MDDYTTNLINKNSPLAEQKGQDAYRFDAQLLDTGLVTTNQIADGAIISDKLAANSVAGSHIINGAVGQNDIASEAIFGTHIGGSVIVGTHIGTAQIGTRHTTVLVPYTGANQSVDLGNNNLTASSLISSQLVSGSNLSLYAANGDTAGGSVGYSVDVNAGNGLNDERGGDIAFNAGQGGTLGGNGGSLIFAGGPATTINGNGGDVVFLAGSNSGAGVEGQVRFKDPTSLISAAFNTGDLSSSDKTFTFPDTTGTFLLKGGVLAADIAGSTIVGTHIGTNQINANKFLGSMTGNISTNGDFIANTAGNGYKIKEGTNARMGTVALSGGSATVSTTAVTTTSRIFLTGQDGNANIGNLWTPSRNAGTDFLVNSTNILSDQTVAWVIVEPA